MVEKFFAWLRFRLGLPAMASELAEIVSHQELTRRQIDGLRNFLNALSEEQQNTQLCTGQVLARCVEVLRDLKDIRRNCEREPHFTLGTAQAWEAVSYSMRKAAADRQLQEQGDVKSEVMQWTRYYMDEHGWPYPGDDAVRELIHMNLRVEETRLVATPH